MTGNNRKGARGSYKILFQAFITWSSQYFQGANEQAEQTSKIPADDIDSLSVSYSVGVIIFCNW